MWEALRDTGLVRNSGPNVAPVTEVPCPQVPLVTHVFQGPRVMCDRTIFLSFQDLNIGVLFTTDSFYNMLNIMVYLMICVL